jgi:hypothetical protein
MPDLLLRLAATSWTGLPIAAIAMFAFGGLLYVAMLRSSPTASSRPSALAVRRPGWIARRRARGGITHRHDRVGVGYTSATRAVHLSVCELAGHGLAVGGPGSGKSHLHPYGNAGVLGSLPAYWLRSSFTAYWQVPSGSGVACMAEPRSSPTRRRPEMLDPTDQPIPRLRASVLREELEGLLERLQELESWIKESAGCDNHELVRADAVAIAIEHLRQAIDALEMASKD